MKQVSALFLSTAFLALSAWPAESAIDLGALDSNVSACEDFYHFACGSWLKNFELPADRTHYNRQSDNLATTNHEQLHALLEGSSQNGTQKLRTFYRSCMDTDQIARETPRFLEQQFLAVEQVQSVKDFSGLVANLHLAGVDAFFIFNVTPDPEDSGHSNRPHQFIGQLSQGGMSLSNRSYYFENNARSAETLSRLTQHISKIFQLTGQPVEELQHSSNLVVDFETQLAYRALPLAEMQETTQLWHPTDLEGIKILAPSFDWAAYFQAMQSDPTQKLTEKLNVTNPDFISGFDAILSSMSMSDIKIYLKWCILRHYAPVLSTPFSTEHFNFWNQYLLGQKQSTPRWSTCTSATANALSSNPTQERNLDGLTVDSNSFLKNIDASALFNKKIELSKIGSHAENLTSDKTLPEFVPDGNSDINNDTHVTIHSQDEINQRTQCLVDQGNAYEVLPGLHVNGQQTLHENISDQRKIQIEYQGLTQPLTRQSPSSNIGSFNERQRFWIAFAQTGCTQETKENLHFEINTDLHAPAEFRTNAVVMNRPEFAQDFNCQPGARMAPANRCSVW